MTDPLQVIADLEALCEEVGASRIEPPAYRRRGGAETRRAEGLVIRASEALPATLAALRRAIRGTGHDENCPTFEDDECPCIDKRVAHILEPLKNQAQR